ncbi:phosphatidic acid phosphatase [Aquipuribacter nitratireducens]|uniref:Phosphatidic acid phosphatase n=1 Tax=Aquipuribacter nitratireducens TaxID=650104 RepID=A0ABW0GSA7_9MICO
MSVVEAEPVNRRQRAARLLTEVFSPAHLAIVLPPVVGAQAGGLIAFAYGCLAALFTGVIPYAFLLWAVRGGRIGDRHVRQRRQRFLPLGFGVVSVIVGLTLLVLLEDAPRDLLALVLAMLAGLVVTVAITAVWQISIHTGVAAGTVVILMLTFGWGSVLAWPLVVATGWARAVLNDHTVAQVVAGAAVGAAVAGFAFSTLR